MCVHASKRGTRVRNFYDLDLQDRRLLLFNLGTFGDRNGSFDSSPLSRAVRSSAIGSTRVQAAAEAHRVSVRGARESAGP